MNKELKPEIIQPLVDAINDMNEHIKILESSECSIYTIDAARRDRSVLVATLAELYKK
jgi:ATP-dependent RNA circularization protein (DNA/RNA ligase family)